MSIMTLHTSISIIQHSFDLYIHDTTILSLHYIQLGYYVIDLHDNLHAYYSIKNTLSITLHSTDYISMTLYYTLHLAALCQLHFTISLYHVYSLQLNSTWFHSTQLYYYTFKITLYIMTIMTLYEGTRWL